MSVDNQKEKILATKQEVQLARAQATSAEAAAEEVYQLLNEQKEEVAIIQELLGRVATRATNSVRRTQRILELGSSQPTAVAALAGELVRLANVIAEATDSSANVHIRRARSAISNTHDTADSAASICDTAQKNVELMKGDAINLDNHMGRVQGIAASMGSSVQRATAGYAFTSGRLEEIAGYTQTVADELEAYTDIL